MVSNMIHEYYNIAINSPGDLSIMATASMAAAACSGGKEAEKQ